jgi:hypothetical protein
MFLTVSVALLIPKDRQAFKALTKAEVRQGERHEAQTGNEIGLATRLVPNQTRA